MEKINDTSVQNKINVNNTGQWQSAGKKVDSTQSLPDIKDFKALCRRVVTGHGGRDLE